jgi:hypothetical protein
LRQKTQHICPSYYTLTPSNTYRKGIIQLKKILCLNAMKKTYNINTEDLVKLVDLLDGINMSARMFKKTKTKEGYEIFISEEDL